MGFLSVSDLQPKAWPHGCLSASCLQVHRIQQRASPVSIPRQDPNDMPDKTEFKLAGKVRETVQDAPNSLVEKALPEAQKAAQQLPSPREPCCGECRGSLSPVRSSQAVRVTLKRLLGCHESPPM